MSPDIGIQFIRIDGQHRSRPYKCPFCGTAFSRFEHRTRHIRTHTREKPYECQHPGCARRFPRLDELKRHGKMHDRPPKRGISSEKQATIQDLERNEASRGGSSSATIMLPSRTTKSRSRTVDSVDSSTASSPSPSVFHSYGQSLQRSSHESQSLYTAPSTTTHDPVAVGSSSLSAYFPHYRTSTHQPSYRHNRLPSLSAYAISRSHSHSSDDDYSYSPSSTPDLATTPIPTSAPHPPHLKPYDHGCYDLPALRNLSLQSAPDLMPMEPPHLDDEYRALRRLPAPQGARVVV